MKQLTERSAIANPKTALLYQQLGELLTALTKKELTPEIIALIDGQIDHVNFASAAGQGFEKTVKFAQSRILKAVEKGLKLVPRNYYKKLWVILGLSTFGLPIGVSIGLSLRNIGLLGVGLPIGMAIGLAVGSSMDKKALDEGRQLDFEVKR